MELLSTNKAYKGWQNVYKHASKTCACDMVFAVYLPPQAETAPVPVLWYLSGLTCTHENAMTKANLQAYGARYGMAVVYPDTSPRGDDVANDEAYDLGQGAGFYLNSTQDPWKKHFQMYDYIVKELPALIGKELKDKLDMKRQGITGHSMGGHGALTIAFKNPDVYTSVSAFAPIVNPTQSDWGRKQFTAYLGSDESQWAEYDASLLLRDKGWERDILIDQGLDDQFIDLLRPEAMASAITESRVAGTVRTHHGYDHSYFFISTFAGDHMRWHAKRLNPRSSGRFGM